MKNWNSLLGADKVRIITIHIYAEEKHSNAKTFSLWVRVSKIWKTEKTVCLQKQTVYAKNKKQTVYAYKKNKLYMPKKPQKTVYAYKRTKKDIIAIYLKKMTLMNFSIL